MLTSARFQQLKAGAQFSDDSERIEFNKTLDWEKRSQAAFRAVATKRRKYTTWPTSRNDHEKK